MGNVAPITTETLRPGDIVRITVWRKPELSGEFQVSADGTVGGPFYMGINLRGLSFAEAAARIRAHVMLYETQPQVLVEPLLRIAIAGEVQRPNVYTLNPSTTLAQAVLLAGGPTQRGDAEHVSLYRAGQRLRLNLNQPGDTLNELLVRSGDYVVVESERSLFKEYVLPTLLAIGAASSIVRLVDR